MVQSNFKFLRLKDTTLGLDRKILLETSCSSARKSWNFFWILNGGTIIIQIATNKAIFSLEASPNLEVFPTLQCIRRVLEVVLCLVIGLNHFWNWQKSDQSKIAKMRKEHRIWEIMKRFIWMIGCLSAMYVARASMKVHLWENIFGFILEKNLMNVKLVENISLEDWLWKCMKKPM